MRRERRGLMVSNTEGVEIRFLFSFLIPLASRGALRLSSVLCWYSFLFQPMASSAASTCSSSSSLSGVWRPWEEQRALV